MVKQYVHTEIIHNFEAAREVVPMVLDLVKPRSVLDVGCGTGTWIKIFEDNGIDDYLGVDGDYVDQSSLKIQATRFVPHDLRKEMDLKRRFDLIVSLEVAEHLPDTSADNFVSSLVRHGDVILFSAAIPGQGGQNHLNEQWPAYWQKKFAKHGLFFHDTIRPLIWDNKKVDWWYRQNIFLITKQPTEQHIMNLVHPMCFEQRIIELRSTLDTITSGRIGIAESAKFLLNSIRSKFSA